MQPKMNVPPCIELLTIKLSRRLLLFEVLEFMALAIRGPETGKNKGKNAVQDLFRLPIFAFTGYKFLRNAKEYQGKPVLNHLHEV